MEKNSRTEKSIKNVSINIVYQIMNLIINFILRTVFIKKLGVELLGINGLFSNILSVLSLADLGINTAMVYSLYKPLYNKEEHKISALLNYYKKIYNIIAIIILGIGILTVPFLKYIINSSSIEIRIITFYYILYLLNSVCSYFTVYRTSVVIADQKEYKLKIIDVYFLIVKFVVQLMILIILNNYTLYLISQIIITISINIVKSMTSSKMYKTYKEDKITQEEKKSIWDNVKSLFLYQIGNVVLNNTDNIIISIMLGTTVVGFYSNYTLIISAITGLVFMIFSALQASIGNLNVNSTPEKKYEIYKVILVFSDYMFSFGTIALICLLNPFITIWIGESFTFQLNTIIIIGFNFYVVGLLYPNWCYRFTTNLFNRAKYIMLIASITNIILSIILGKIWGINGILIATAISRLVSTFWYEAKLLYKYYFEVKVSYFLKIELKNLLYTILVFTITFLSINFIKNTELKSFILKTIIVIIIPNFLYLIRYANSEEMKYIFSNIIKNKLIKTKKK